ncbi:HAD family hydrolase [Aquibacillus albus]|uniref:Cof subfamily protein (Haloacid dehalogenase superfamily) n=1 Tax=Aquibacillus albus TaxID=1168171 RepID=A0ABS2MYA1_9BACI|nr:HAD family hydrolase [Aquibacillus albus]MBM7570857.1 Cof subfamily protein (haloacid dehalogenase superfamily) [Aquibacillus albus]
MNYKILFLDIDGTILRADHTIEASTKDAIHQVKEKGIEIFIATGRPLHEVYDIAEALHIGSFIGYNGALAKYQDKEIVNETIDSSTIHDYLATAKKHGHEMVLYTSSKNTFTSMDAPVVKEFINYFDLKENEWFRSDVINDILGITIMNVKENEASLYETEDIYLSQVNVEGLKHSYDVIQNRVNKGRAVNAILKLLQIHPDEAIAFGDGMNDKEMLQNVGESFAMGNGHPDLFQYAKRRTSSVMDSGIFNGLKSIGLVK